MSARRGSSRAKLALGLAVVLALTQALNVFLGVSAFRSAYEEALRADLGAALAGARRAVADGLAFGRPLTRIPGVDEALAAALAAEPRRAAVRVLGPSGEVAYRAARTESAAGAAPAAASPAKAGREAPRFSLEIAAEGALLARLEVAYDGLLLEAAIGDIYRSSLLGSALVLLPTLLLVALAFALDGGLAARRAARGGPTAGAPADGRPGRGLTLALAALVLASQLGSGLWNNAVFREAFVGLAQGSVRSAATLAAAEVEALLARGLKPERMRNLELLLESRRRANPAVGRLEFRAPGGELLYGAGRGAIFSILGPATRDPADAGAAGAAAAAAPASESRAPGLGAGLARLFSRGVGGRAESPARLPDGSPAGRLVAEADADYLGGKLRDIALDGLTLMVVALVLCFEAFGFLVAAAGRRALAKGRLEPALAEPSALGLVRSTSFVFFSAAFFPLSFLPLFVESAITGGLGALAAPGGAAGAAPGAVLLGLPFTSYLAGVTLLIPLTALVSNPKTFRLVYLLGGAAFALGSGLAAVAEGLLPLALARFLAGVGYGAIITNATTLVVGVTSREGRTRGFGALSGGIASATICAMPVGGIVVNRLGLRAGMSLAAILALLAAAFLVLLPGREKLHGAEDSPAPRPRLRELLGLLGSPRLLGCLLFSSLPYILADAGVFAFLFPLYMSELRIGQADIGRLMTLYGLVALAVPLVARVAGGRAANRRFLLLGNLVAGLALLAFLVSTNVWLFAGAVLLLGLGLMFSDAVKEAFVADTPEAARIGETRLLGFYETAEKVMGMGVPLLAGLLVSGLGYAKGAAAIGAFSILSVLLLALTTRERKA